MAVALETFASARTQLSRAPQLHTEGRLAFDSARVLSH